MALPTLGASTGNYGKVAKIRDESIIAAGQTASNAASALSANAKNSAGITLRAQALTNQTGGNILGFTYE